MELDYRNILPLLVWNGGRVVADGTLHLEAGIWTSHVGKMRLLVHPSFRRRGIGNVLMHELITVADELGLHKLVYECAEEQTSLMGFLRRCDFDEIARLPDFIQDGTGQRHAMVLLAQQLA
ncbi:unnamed protein product [marine sediment metagenome]|uniref:N-acetyltransferase domain-containing protein n=1 Tax=marine sediment metagenome TaxID=412755 RepID=X0TTU4_9ZZZZ